MVKVDADMGDNDKKPGNLTLNNKFKRKRKSGQFSRLKKFGVQGKHGQGFQIEQETYDYFLRAFELASKNNQFATEEELQNFIDNVFTQTEGEEVNLSSNQFVSRVIELLITKTSNSDNLIKFSAPFSPALRTICSDLFASHVLEKLVEVIAIKWAANPQLVTWFRNTAKFILNNFEEFIFEKTPNFIMRKVTQALGGRLSAANLKKGENENVKHAPLQIEIKEAEKSESVKKGDEDKEKEEFSKGNAEILKSFAERFFEWPQFFDLFNSSSCIFVQVLILALRGIDNELALSGAKKIVKAISPEGLNETNFPCLEVAISSCKESPLLLKKIFKKYFRSRCIEFSCTTPAHFSIEQIFYAISSEKLFEEIMGELVENLHIVVKAGNISVLAAIAEACKKLGLKQSVFINELSRLSSINFHEDSPPPSQNFFVNILNLGNRDTTQSSSRYGSILIQHIMDFHKPFKIISSILELESSKLGGICKDPKGSYVMESFFKSTSIGEKNKEKVLDLLEDQYVNIACDKFGSRVMDSIFITSNEKRKKKIQSILQLKKAAICSDKFGAFVAAKFGLKFSPRELQATTEDTVGKKGGVKRKSGDSEEIEQKKKNKVKKAKKSDENE